MTSSPSKLVAHRATLLQLIFEDNWVTSLQPTFENVPETSLWSNFEKLLGDIVTKLNLESNQATYLQSIFETVRANLLQLNFKTVWATSLQSNLEAFKQLSLQSNLVSCLLATWHCSCFATFHYDRERGVYVWYISYTWHIPAQSLMVIHILSPVYLWYMSYTIQTSVNVPSTKIPHLELEWAVYGDVCQIYIRNWQLHRNL